MDEHLKRFNDWNKKKKDLNGRTMPDSFFFLEREIWWLSIGVNIGNEIDGKNENFERPVLIIKKFDESSFLGLPITSQQHVDTEFYPFIQNGIERYIYLRQIRFLNIQRLQRLVGRMSEEEFLLVKKKVLEINF